MISCRKWCLDILPCTNKVSEGGRVIDWLPEITPLENSSFNRSTHWTFFVRNFLRLILKPKFKLLVFVVFRLDI
jgi:hypothetical protein